MKKIILYCQLAMSVSTFAQLPDTDIFLSDIKNDHGKFSFSTPVNITARVGYDNQPSFTPDGKSLLFVSVKDTTQSDVYKYDLNTKKVTQITRTGVSEYSPSYSRDKKNISVVRVDKDTGQRFYNLPIADPNNAHVVKGTDSIGYYCQLNDTLLAMFILGKANTLQVLNIRTTERKLIASDIGRCLKLDADQRNLLFVIKQNENEWSIFKMNILTFAITKIISTLKGNEDFAVMPNGSLLMGSEGKLYQYQPNNSNDWKMIADLSSSLKSFYRISINAKGDKIAFVAYTGKKP
jgi:dipeptidyl aminopeptidase/acylaminoacyl peptidase